MLKPTAAETKSVETPLVIDAVKEPEASVEDLAARDFTNAFPKFLSKMEHLNNRSLKKVIAALMLHPFETGNINWSYVQDYELFTLGCKINDCKFVMMRAVMEMKKEEIDALMAEQSPNVPETKEEEVKTNG